MKPIIFLPILYILILITGKILNCYSTINWLEIILLLPFYITISFFYYKITEFLINKILKEENLPKEKVKTLIFKSVFFPANVLITGIFLSIGCLLIVNLYLGEILLIITALSTIIIIIRAYNIELTSKKKSLRGLFFILFILNPVLYLSYIPLRYEFIDVMIIENNEMSPTIENKNIILINKLKGMIISPKNNDLVVINNPLQKEKKNNAFSLLTRGLHNNHSYIRRVVGTPGDTIKFNVKMGIERNNENLKEPYLKEKENEEICNLVKHCYKEETRINNYYLLGDNRNASQDSRIWSEVNIKFLKGKTFAIIWPRHKARIMH